MQDVASEMNLSETAFLQPRDGEFELRWFTPNQEVDLCGHATLASAHVLWDTGRLGLEREARFHTRSGLLTATLEDDLIQMNFPSEPPEPAPAPAELLAALDVNPVYSGRNRFDFILEVSDAQQVRDLAPDFSRLRKLDCRGVIVCARSDTDEFDFISRFFAPAAGVDEDPVTGSAHCCLGPYWAGRLGKQRLTGFQASKRGGIVNVEVRGDRVLLGGKAITVLKGSMLDWQEGPTMESKSSYEKKMRRQFQEWGGKVDELLANVERRAQGGYEVLAREATEKREILSKRLSALEKSSGEAWKELKPGLEEAWSDLREAVEKAAARFRK